MSPLQQKALHATFEELRKLKIGQPLPSERNLAAQAGVTRTVIRGLMSLLTKERVVRRQGRNWVLQTAIKRSLLMSASENPVSRRQQVKDFLLAELGSGKLEPGQGFTELEIARELGVAMISVREALLEMMPLGVFIKNKSRQWTVVAFTPENISEMREFREMAELFCLRKLIAQGISPHSRQKLEGIRTETHNLLAVKRTRTDKMLTTDLNFHRLLLEASGNSLITERSEFIYMIIGFQLVSPFFSLKRARLGLRQHLAIIDAIMSGKSDTAEEQLIAHIHAAQETLCAIVRKSSSLADTRRAR